METIVMPTEDLPLLWRAGALLALLLSVGLWLAILAVLG